MRRITSMAIPGLALLSLFMAVPRAWAQTNNKPRAGNQPAPAASAAPVQRWTICFVQGESTRTDRGIRTTIYVSGTVSTVPPQNEQDVGKAFGQFIANKFLPQGLHSDARCWSAASPAEAQRAIKQPGTTAAPGQGFALDCTRWNTQCVMTDWTYTPAPVTVPPAAPSAHSTPPSGITVPAAASHPVTPTPQPTPANPVPPAQSASALTKAYHCVLYVHQGTKSVRYSSSPVQTDAPVSSVNDAWSSYARATYHISDPHTRGGCQILSGIPANRDRAVNSLEENWKRLHAEVIHVNWTSAPGQTFASATPPPAPAHAAAAPAATHTGAPAATPAAPAPLGADPRLAAIPSRIRGLMIGEATGNESSCRNDPAGYVRIDCRCFAKKVLDYRIAHASDYQLVYEEHDLVGHIVGWGQVPSVVDGAKLSCAQ